MIKTILIALIYFFIGLGIAASCKSDNKDDPGFVAFVLIFWPLVFAFLLIVLVFGFIILGADGLRKKWRGE